MSFLRCGRVFFIRAMVLWRLIFLNLIEVWLIYNVVLISDEQHSDSVIHILFFTFFSIMVYQRILNMFHVPDSRILVFIHPIHNTLLC